MVSISPTAMAPPVTPTIQCRPTARRYVNRSDMTRETSSRRWILPLSCSTRQQQSDLISDVLPFGRMWYDTPDNAIGYAMHSSRSHDAVIRVYDDAGNVIETHE